MPPSGSKLPRLREWSQIYVVNNPLKWILVIEKGSAAYLLVVGRQSLFRSVAGGLVITVRGMISYSDRAIVATIAASFPEGRLYGLFDTDISGLAAYMTLKTGTPKHCNHPEYEELFGFGPSWPWAPLQPSQRRQNCSIPRWCRPRRPALRTLRQPPEHWAWNEHPGIKRWFHNMGIGPSPAFGRGAVNGDHLLHIYTHHSGQGLLLRQRLPKFKHANVIIEDLATVRDFWHQAWRACEENGKRPTELKLVANWELHKRRRSED